MSNTIKEGVCVEGRYKRFRCFAVTLDMLSGVYRCRSLPFAGGALGRLVSLSSFRVSMSSLTVKLEKTSSSKMLMYSESGG